MEFPLNIVPNRGLGTIPFGATPEHVRSQLGPPSAIEDWRELNQFSARWIYDNPACTLFFVERSSWDPALPDPHTAALVLITALSRRFMLLGGPVIGETVAAITSRLAEHGYGDPQISPMDDPSSPEQKHLCYGTHNLDLHFSDGVATHIQWSMPVSKIA
jgi:hypothetical protein